MRGCPTGAGTAAQLVAHIVSVLDPANGVLVHLAGDTLALTDRVVVNGMQRARPGSKVQPEERTADAGAPQDK